MNKQAERRNVVLLSSGRKGTFLLLTALEPHPQVKIYGQVLGRTNPHPEESASHLLARLYDACPPAIRAVVLPVAWHQGKRRPGLWEGLRDRKVRVVYLKRCNMLRWYVSRQLAVTTGVWSLTASGDGSPPTLRVDPKHCQWAILADRAGEEAVGKHFENHPSLTIVYEEVTRDFDGQIDRLQRFLGVEPLTLRPRTMKQERRPLREVIENFEELRREWAGTPWESFLEEGAEPVVNARRPS